MIKKLMGWRHSGFSIDNGVRIKRNDTKGKEAVAQYIIRNVFNIKKVKFVEKTQKVIYQGRMKKGKNRKNFEVYSVRQFYKFEAVNLGIIGIAPAVVSLDRLNITHFIDFSTS